MATRRVVVAEREMLILDADAFAFGFARGFQSGRMLNVGADADALAGRGYLTAAVSRGMSRIICSVITLPMPERPQAGRLSRSR